MKFVYLAAPLSPIAGETVESNIARAKAIYRLLCLRHPDIVFLATWILNCEVFEDTPENRRIGMLRNYAVIKICHELWLVGPRVSTGMGDERFIAEAACVEVTDMTGPEWVELVAVAA